MEPSEQAQSTPPPGRRRRRWLIVAFVLVLVSIVSWYWPRGDARLVGKWALVTEATVKSFATLTFHPRVASIDWGGGRTGYSTWTVEGESLVLGPNQLRMADVLLVGLDDLLYRVFSGGRPSRYMRHQVRIISMTPETVRLKWDGKPGRIPTGLLRRIPE